MVRKDPPEGNPGVFRGQGMSGASLVGDGTDGTNATHGTNGIKPFARSQALRLESPSRVATKATR